MKRGCKIMGSLSSNISIVVQRRMRCWRTKTSIERVDDVSLVLIITATQHILHSEMVKRMPSMPRMAHSHSECPSAAGYRLFYSARMCLEETDLNPVSGIAGAVSELARKCGAHVVAACIGTRLTLKMQWLHNLHSASSWERSKRV